MVVKVYETNGCAFENSVFADIAKYQKLSTWLEAVVKNECSFRSLDCSVNVNGKEYVLISSRVVNKDAEKILKKIRKGIPAKVNNFPNDYVEITASWLDRELYFKVKY